MRADGHRVPDDPFVAVYTARGAFACALRVRDVLVDWDLWKIRNHRVEYELRNDGFVVKIAKTDSEPVQRRIDVATATFDDPALVRVPSDELYARAEFGPMATFPDVMVKARVRGPVIVDMVVSEFGEVLCTRASALPFGGTEAAANAARRWTFTPMNVDGRRVKFAGELLFHFDEIDEETWREQMRYAPPYEE